MPQPLLVRAAVLAGAAATSLTAGALVAPAAHADDATLPPGLSRLPESSAAPLVAVPLTDPLGRKWR